MKRTIINENGLLRKYIDTYIYCMNLFVYYYLSSLRLRQSFIYDLLLSPSVGYTYLKAISINWIVHSTCVEKLRVYRVKYLHIMTTRQILTLTLISLFLGSHNHIHENTTHMHVFKIQLCSWRLSRQNTTAVGRAVAE